MSLPYIRGNGRIDLEAVRAAGSDSVVTQCSAFHEIVDGMRGGVCVCCYVAPDPAKVSSEIAALLTFFDCTEYLKSKAHARQEVLRTTDVSARAAKTVREHVTTTAATCVAYFPQKVCAAANATAGLCFASPPCSMGRTLWVYSTPAGRKFLRRLAKKGRHSKLGIKICMAGAHDTPRFVLRMYSVRLDRKHTFQAVDAFWHLVLDIAQSTPQEATGKPVTQGRAKLLAADPLRP
jgi:hypothetical protein